MVAHARKILDAAAADHHHRVFLQVVAFARNVADDLEAVGQTHLGDLAQAPSSASSASSYRRACRRRASAGKPAGGGAFSAVGLLLPRLADQLADRRHSWPFEIDPEPLFPRAG